MIVSKIKCASCGASFTLPPDERDNPEQAAKYAATLLRQCPGRVFGHPAFGYEPRWLIRVADDGFHTSAIEVAWTSATWGQPFNFAEIEVTKL